MADYELIGLNEAGPDLRAPTAADTGTVAGDVNVTGTVTAATYTGALASAVTATTQPVSDNSTKVATTAYVDASSAAHDSLEEVLVVGNTTGGTDIVVTSGDVLTTNTINETTAASGVTIDSVLLKDNTVTATTYSGALASTVTATTQAASDNSTKVATTAYVDTSSAAHDSLAEVLAVGNITGGTDLVVSAGDDFTTLTLGLNNFVIGSTAGDSIISGGNYNTLVGDEAGTAVTTGDNNTAHGYRAGSTLSTASNSTLIGFEAGRTLTGATNTAVGSESMETATSGVDNAGLGYRALRNIDGSRNVAVGSNAMRLSAGASNNVAVGFEALELNTTGASNVAIGYQSMNNNTTGENNTAIGFASLDANTIGTFNVAVGNYALESNTTGVDNIAIGGRALDANTTGQRNVAVGKTALSDNTTGSENTAVGYLALTNATTAVDNVAMGAEALHANITGASNTAIGSGALFANTASDNTAVGRSALLDNTTGSENTAVGRRALANNTNADSNTAVGYDSLVTNTTGHENVAVGTNALYDNVSGDDNTAVGYNALYNNTAHDNTAFGHRTLAANTTGANNVAVGHSALNDNTTASNNTAVGNDALLANTTGGENTALGALSLISNTSGEDNVAVGVSALYSNTTGDFNTAVGRLALKFNTTAAENSAFGYSALTANTTGANNTAVGYSALVANTTGAYNTALGRSALAGNTTGTSNIAIGGFALDANTTSNYSTAIGYQALGVATGASNTALGRDAGLDVTTGSNLTLIGHNAQPSSATATNEMTFGDTNVTLNRFNGTVTTEGLVVNSGTENIVATFESTDAGSYINIIDSASGAYGAMIGALGDDILFSPNNVERMRIDASGNVGIGTSAPSSLYTGAKNLVLGGGSDEAGMTIYSSTTTTANIYFADGTAGAAAYAGYMEYSHASDYFRIGTAAAERLRITSAGSVGIGTDAPDGTLHVHSGSAGTVTANANADDLVVENNGDAGISILSTDAEQSRVIFGSPSDDFGAALIWDYTSSEFKSGSSAVGASHVLAGDNLVTNLTLSGASGSELAVFAGDFGSGETVTSLINGTTAEGIVWDEGSKILCAAKASGAAIIANRQTDAGIIIEVRDSAAVIGGMGSDSSNNLVLFADTTRAANLTLSGAAGSELATFAGDVTVSGGVYLGGTGAANLLDDYEEGTWTPTINAGTVAASGAVYTKIGNQVTVRATLGDISDNTSTTGISIGGLPFTSAVDSASTASSMFRYFSKTNSQQMNVYMGSNTSIAVFYWSFDNGTSWATVEFQDGTASNMDLIFTVTYTV